MEITEPIEQNTKPPSWEEDVVDYLQTTQKAQFSHSDKQSILASAQVLRSATHEELRPLIDAIPNGERRYLEALASQATGIHAAQLRNPQFDFEMEKENGEGYIRGVITKGYEDDQHMREFGISLSSEAKSRWEFVQEHKPEVKPVLEGFGIFTQGLIASGAETRKWFVGIEKVKEKFFGKIQSLQLHLSENPDSDLTTLINTYTMDCVDELGLAIEAIPEKNGRDKTLEMVAICDGYLKTQGIERRRPKIGEKVDFTYQEAVKKDGNSSGENIIGVTANAYFDTKTNRYIRPAKVVI